MSDTQLRPCPFCGSSAILENGFAPLESVTYAFCSNSHCLLHSVEIGFSAEQWNTRTTEGNGDVEAKAAELIQRLRWLGPSMRGEGAAQRASKAVGEGKDFYGAATAMEQAADLLSSLLSKQVPEGLVVELSRLALWLHDEHHDSWVPEVKQAIAFIATQGQSMTLEQSMSEAKVCCGEYGTCHRPCMPRGRWQATQDRQNITCPTCNGTKQVMVGDRESHHPSECLEPCPDCCAIQPEPAQSAPTQAEKCKTFNDMKVVAIISTLLFLGVFGIMTVSLIVFGVTNEMDFAIDDSGNMPLSAGVFEQ